jgi:MFS family permease
MLTTYRRVLALPGALVFSLSGLVARLPISMVSLGIVLLVSTRTGSYSLAGTVSASYLIANALFAVLQARFIDRLGQSRVLPVAVTVFAVGMVAMMWAVETDVRAPWPHLCAALSGAAMPQIGSCVRARWSLLVPDKQALHTAFAFEAVIDETVFILGPALVTVLATTVHPLAGLVTAVVAAVVGTAVLVGQRRTEPPATGATRHHGSGPMPWLVLAPLIACAFTLGALLGGAEVATVAFADELGSKPLSGLMLALWALGSLLSGVITGALRLDASNATRFRWGMLLLGLLMLPLPFVSGFVPLGFFLFLSGFAISPTLIASFAWIEETVPAGRLTEGITLFTTGLAAGLAPGAALVGLVVDAHGASASYWVTVVAGLLGAVLAFVAARVTRTVSGAGPVPTGSSS